MDGILIVNKEANMTSFDVVKKVSKILNIKKIGHTGTLDPIATGVLVLCIGEATKLVEIITSLDKVYEAEVTLGILTDTLDITGNVIKKDNINLNKEDIIHSINNMQGTYNQEVPIYSAVKINGKKLYEYARNNEKVELPKRMVDIKKIELTNYKDNKFEFKCLVSKGTYIRSLINDICKSLNTIGVMSKLNRTKQGKFKIEDSFTLEDIINNNFKIIPMLDVLDDLYQVEVDDTLENKIRNGVILDNIYDKDVVVFKNKNKLISIYKKYEKDNTKIKPWKTFKK